MSLNKPAFFATVRSTLFGGKLSAEQVKGMEAILDGWHSSQLTDTRWLAYMLATAYHETAKTMQPVRETLAASDDQAISRLESAWKRGIMPWVKSPYWRKDKDGESWLGRGLVQLTHKANYIKMAAVTGVDLVAHPDSAMRDDVAVKILISGMTEGSFTGKKLADYFNDKSSNWVSSRRIINGTDKAALIAGYAKKFHAAITGA